jgi:hypothetical protein
MDPMGKLMLICKALWILLRGSLMHTFDPLCVFKWFTGRKPGNTQRDDFLLSLNDQMEWFRRYYGIISDGIVTDVATDRPLTKLGSSWRLESANAYNYTAKVTVLSSLLPSQIRHE